MGRIYLIFSIFAVMYKNVKQMIKTLFSSKKWQALLNKDDYVKIVLLVVTLKWFGEGMGSICPFICQAAQSGDNVVNFTALKAGCNAFQCRL